MKNLVWRRASTVLAAALVVVAALEVPALAAPPTNDSIGSATPLGTAPNRFAEDTSTATSSANDGSCVFGASVWFKYRPKVNATVRLSTLGSDYEAILAVFRGTRTNRTRIACAYDPFDFSYGTTRQVHFVAGNTYWIAVSACCRRGNQGGQLVLNTFPPTDPGASPTVSDVEAGTVSGRLYVTGTMPCTTPSETELDVSASQLVGGGDHTASGGASFYGDCGTDNKDGADMGWSVTIDSQSGWAFKPGDVTVAWSGYVWDGFGYADLPSQKGNFLAGAGPNVRVPAHVALPQPVHR